MSKPLYTLAHVHVAVGLRLVVEPAGGEVDTAQLDVVHLGEVVALQVGLTLVRLAAAEVRDGACSPAHSVAVLRCQPGDGKRP